MSKIKNGALAIEMARANLTQEKLALRVNCSRSTIGRALRGERITTPGISVRIASALSTTPDKIGLGKRIGPEYSRKEIREIMDGVPIQEAKIRAIDLGSDFMVITTRSGEDTFERMPWSQLLYQLAVMLPDFEIIPITERKGVSS